MHELFTTLVSRMIDLQFNHAGIIEWSMPVPVFGDYENATVATVGINPSNIEFVDSLGMPLSEADRRLETLNTLDLNQWMSMTCNHITQMQDACIKYFRKKPYRIWFDRMLPILSAFNASYYEKSFFGYDETVKACHLDIVPYATSNKWNSLDPSEKSTLLEMSYDVIPRALACSKITTLILNGQGVVNMIKDMYGIHLNAYPCDAWNLNRKQSAIQGVGYYGVFDELGGVLLDREVAVYGYNHNIQSSFGVTTEAVNAISAWLQHYYLLGGVS